MLGLAGFAVYGGAAEPAADNARLPQITSVTHTPSEPHSDEPVRITANVRFRPSKVTLNYQLVDPGEYIDLKDAAFETNWIGMPMADRGAEDPARTGDGLFTATLPAGLQRHRRLVRYRISVVDSAGRTHRAPAADDPVPNFAYFVDGGIPPWRGAIEPRSTDPKRRQPVEFGTNVMRRVQAYQLISKANSVENVTWREQAGGKEYKYTGTMVSEGKVYDHIRFRARGGVWRYAMGKNMWKFEFNKGQPFEARDDFGRPYPTPWSKVNLRACIQQGDYGERGEQGMFEAVGFRLFNLAGVAAPNTHWIQLRIIDGREENPADQYQGDFWGLYLAIENEDGHFLKAHGLPDGNLYKMEGGGGALSNHGAGAVTNQSDLDRFMAAYSSPRQTEQWWRENVDLPRYYSYRSILECIHHYDVAEGKNYDYYLNPHAGKWIVIPWDIDLTWADQMYGNGAEPFKRRVLAHPNLRHQYQNRLREIRDLLFNPDQTWQLIDECAAIIADPSGAPSLVDADRAKWDYHPAMANGGKSGQGLFYQAAPTKDFAGMVRVMKDYVKARGAWIDSTLLKDAKPPPPPAVTSTSPGNFPVDRLRFSCSVYEGTNGFAAMEWRVGEITNTNAPGFQPSAPRIYEITPVWQSGELTAFRSSVEIPAGVTRAGHTYRVRARWQDASGRWSHWSAPVEFGAGKQIGIPPSLN